MLRHTILKTLRRFAASGYQPLNHVVLHRRHLLHNVRLNQSQHPDFTIIPVLKSNAYGHGIVPIAEMLRTIPGRMVAVDGYFEAEKIRRATNLRVLVMGYVLPANVHLLDTKGCSFVVQDVAGLRAFGALARPVRIHLELNTGMNRLGLQSTELAPYLAELKSRPNLRLEGVMTHLADADNPASESFNDEQLRAFDDQVETILAAGFRPRFVHIAQTAGSSKIRSRYANAIRLGIGTYGINPLQPEDPRYHKLTALKPVLELKSTIIKIIELKPGDRVSYNGTFTAVQPTRAGVLPLGYYEGVARGLSNVGCFTHNGQELPILGRICMNHTVVDLGPTDLQVGDEVTVISADPAAPNSVAGLAVRHGLFAYTTLTSISSTIRRKIV